MKLSFPLVIGVLLIQSAIAAPATNYHLASPDGRLAVDVEIGRSIRYSLAAGERKLIEPSAISLTLSDHEKLGTKPLVKEAHTDSVSETITPPFYKKRTIADNFNRLLRCFEGQYAIEFRACNDGLAYRYSPRSRGDIPLSVGQYTP